ncbi:hypothetical protein [Kamptonema sp. UHCC 0994]|uniref:hypothetical protein n=1 Tax=Kamptonema sp. UHCC 0994 TaxID=3031329 RepID=UPI0023B8B0F3|nr:hypothetical protein [Kamptonema sp. UHCC 0994]MDF0554952.1 hypothetical protein [Kamptonema sp. UHCC 0994]
MPISQIMAVAKSLNRADRLRLALFLLSELAQEEGVSYPVQEGVSDFSSVTLYNSYEAAEIMLQELAKES